MTYPLTRQRLLLDFDGKDQFVALFASSDPDIPGSRRMVTMGREDWEEMGEPDRITVSIEPGDWLSR